ncbi:MAG: FG-GAP repeat protein [Planctomycetes bacterium]|nr:FG-GAP repeat protein [Planctomycetota bacterium]
MSRLLPGRSRPNASFAVLGLLALAPLTRAGTPSSPSPASETWVETVRADLARSEYSFSPRDDGSISAPNRAQELRFVLDTRGLRAEPRDPRRDDPWSLELTTRGLGRAGAVERVPAGELRSNGARAELVRGTVTEWFVNDERGLEQGWTLATPVAGDRARPVVLQLGLEGGLDVLLAEDERSASLRDCDGEVRARYRDLAAFDAAGRALSARLVATPDGLEVHVDDRDADYPLTIDPLLTGPTWTAESNQASAQFGISVAAAGDVNADGFGDVVVGAWFYDNGQTDEGRAYVYLGSASGLALSPVWTNEINNTGAFYGVSVSAAGDVNGDGIDDLLVGACTYSNGQAAEGSAYVYLGSPAGPSLVPAWSAESNQASALYAISVGNAGDVNADGYDDILVGGIQWTNGQTNEGKAWMYLGSPTGPALTESWSVEGNLTNALYGNCVAGAGDVNADGFADVVVGAPTFNGGQSGEGKAFLYLGSAGGLATSAAWTFESNQIDAGLGNPCAGAGDVNGDGYGDVLVGAPGFDNGQADEGRTLVFLGGAAGLALTPAWTVESDQAGARFGTGAACAGDVNGDGYADVVVGAPLYDAGQSDEGRAFLYLGGASGLATTPAWTSESNQPVGDFGRWVASAGDVNGDGYGDVIVGAPLYDSGQADEGRTYLFTGGANGLALAPAWTAESDQPFSNSGHSVARAGDVNADGYDDVIVGAWLYDNGETDEGAAFVYLGGASGLATTPAALLESNVAAAFFGISVSAAGDVNGDGYDDVIVGACSYTNGEANEGAAYVYLGHPLGLNTAPAWQVESNQSNALFGFAVAGNGDVNGDGYSDVLAGAIQWTNGESAEGKVFLYYGSPAGLPVVASWTYESNVVGALLGNSLALVGDVNGDGHGDVLAGAPFFTNGEANEGAVFVFHGSATGPASVPSWSFETNQANAFGGQAVANAGDVNGDGFSDVLVAAPSYDNGQVDEGRVSVFHGSVSGLALAPNATYESNQVSARFGASVAGVGDVNGDGYGDVLVGAPAFDNGQTDEGRASLYLGSAGGLAATAAWNGENDQASSSFGNSVAGAGDVNGDGFADAIVAAEAFDGGQSDEGRAYLYYGGEGAGLARLPRQLRSDGSAPIPLYGNSLDTSFQLRARARSAAGRAAVALEYEVKPLGVPFNGAALGRSAAFTDTGAPVAGSFADLSELVVGLVGSTPYHWRVRTLSDNPRFPRSPWISAAGNAITESKVGASSGSGTPFCFGDGSGTACPCGNASAPGAGRGCNNSTGNAAKLDSSGIASLGADSVLLHAAQMTGTTSLYFQGTGVSNGGAGAVLGDGLLCLDGTLIRLGTRFNTGNSSTFGFGVTQLVSIRGQVTQPGVRRYQVWYRNASAGFCPPSTFNLSNGLELVWGP